MTALVAGASGGIGRAIAAELLENGCDVAVTYHSNRDGVAPLEETAERLGRRCLVHRLDVRDREQTAEVCGRVMAELGTPNVLVTSAGIFRDRPLARMAFEDWAEVIEVNLHGVFHLVRQIAPAMMRNGGGRIVNVASVSGLFGQPGQANYSASKGGVLALTRALARELGPFGVTVNAIAPGLVDTEMTRDLAPELKRRFLERIPLRRLATPDDVVPAARLLMAPDGAYITGQVLIVDGGLTS
jgi:3-oxoacyl-[acyl-carrier protein] reductase